MSPELRERMRITRHEIESSAFSNLEGYLIGKGIMHNPNIVRKDDILTGDIVFYERTARSEE